MVVHTLSSSHGNTHAHSSTKNADVQSALHNQCKRCQEWFGISHQQQTFLQGMGMTHPKLCPACRRQRRLAFRNERRMYHRLCDESGKEIIALYPKKKQSRKPVVTYDQNSWWDYDKMNPLDFGRPYDFNKPFFQQFLELKMSVPRPNLHNTNVENAMYGNHCVGNKDCYMNIGSDLCEGCQFTYWAIRCKDCIDCSLSYDCELCYDCADIRLSFNCQQVDNSESMIDCRYCYDCTGCQNCFGCTRLRHKEYHFLNKPLSKSEYESHVRYLHEHPEAFEQFVIEYEKLRIETMYCAYKNIQSEDCLGDRLWRCRGSYNSFDLEKCYDVHNSSFGFDGTTSSDMDFFGRIEKMYEGFSAFGQYNCIATIMCHYSHDCHYSEYCVSSHHCFGCISLHHHSYCILNRHYSKAEYEELLPRIVEHMRTTGEWGEFFPIQLSPFPYNVTVAQKLYPLTKEEITNRGWHYEDEDAKDQQQRKAYENTMSSLPHDEHRIDSSICQKVLRCDRTGRPYKITAKQYDYLVSRNLALPRLHWDERNEVRMARRNAQHLWERPCQKCKKSIQTSYSPQTSFCVACEECYRTQVY